MNLKATTILTVLFASIIICAQKKDVKDVICGRIDIDGRENKIVLTPLEISEGSKMENAESWKNAEWWKGDANQYLRISPQNLEKKKWKEVKFTFKPNATGKVLLKLRGPWKNLKNSKKKPREIWIAYDSVTIDGAKLQNGDFEEVDDSGIIKGWKVWGKGKSIKRISNKRTAATGKACVIAWHASPVNQFIDVKKDQPVTITLKTKFAKEGSIKK